MWWEGGGWQGERPGASAPTQPFLEEEKRGEGSRGARRCFHSLTSLPWRKPRREPRLEVTARVRTACCRLHSSFVSGPHVGLAGSRFWHVPVRRTASVQLVSMHTGRASALHPALVLR